MEFNNPNHGALISILKPISVIMFDLFPTGPLLMGTSNICIKCNEIKEHGFIFGDLDV
jgi:hypothetical protein